MGIQGLLPMLKDIQKKAHIKDYADKTLAVDAYVWLHRGAYGYAQDLALNKPNIKFIDYALRRIRLLQHYGVKPYVVFDGGTLPAKLRTEDSRERSRNEALTQGKLLLAEGKHSQAREHFVKAVDITPAMAFQLIKALRAESVDYVVAPYEADAQLAYLEKKGLVDGIITEDSDLLVFGCKHVLFKLEETGECVAISRSDFSRCKTLNLATWTDKEFRQMAILSGCDYLESIQGMGLKTAHRLMRKYRSAVKVVQSVRLEGQLRVPQGYLQAFERAESTFLYQRVFDPVSKLLVHLQDLDAPLSDDLLIYVGKFLPDDLAAGIARGDIDPISQNPMVDISPTTTTPALSKKPTKTAPEPSKAPSILNYFTKGTPPQPKPQPPAPTPVSRKRDVLGELKGNSAETATINKKRVTSKFFAKPISLPGPTPPEEGLATPQPDSGEDSDMIPEEEDGDQDKEGIEPVKRTLSCSTASFTSDEEQEGRDLPEPPDNLTPIHSPRATTPVTGTSPVTTPSSSPRKRRRTSILQRTPSPSEPPNSPKSTTSDIEVSQASSPPPSPPPSKNRSAPLKKVAAAWKERYSAKSTTVQLQTPTSLSKSSSTSSSKNMTPLQMHQVSASSLAKYQYRPQRPASF